MIVFNKKKLENFLKLKNFSPELKVTNEKIEKIEHDTFENFATNVEKLDLSKNELKFLSFKIFIGFNKLLKLFLESNNFENIRDVYVMDETISDGEVGTIPIPILQLEVLNLSENLLTEIKLLDFTYLVNLTILSLQNNKIENIEDASFSKLINLECLDLSSNFLKSVNKKTFQGLTNIKQIYLDNNKIATINDESFQELPNIIILRLNKNELGKISSLLFKGLVSLTVLNLQSANIQKIEDESFADLKNLETLILTNNELKNITYKMMKGLKSVTQLFLDSNEIEYISSDCFRDLTNLSQLYLYKNQINSIANILQDLKNLTVLNVSSNKLEKINEKTLRGLDNLQEIDLENNQIDFIEFKGLNNLTKISLSYNRMKTINARAFLDLANISDIVLKHNKIEKLETNAFKDLANLTRVDLSFNKLKTIDPEAIGLYKDLKKIENVILFGNQIETIDFITFIKLIRLNKKNINHFKMLKINNINFFPEGLEKLNQNLVDELVQFSLQNNLSKYFCVGLMLKCGLYLDEYRSTDAHKQILEYIFAVKFTENSEFKGFTEFVDLIHEDETKNTHIDDVKRFILTYLTDDLEDDIYYKTLMQSESEMFSVLTEFGLVFKNDILINYLKTKQFSKFEDLINQFLFLNKQPIKSNAYFILLNSLFWTVSNNNLTQTLFDYLLNTEISIKKYTTSYLLDLIFSLNGVYFNTTVSSEYLNLSAEANVSLKYNDYDIFKSIIFTFNQEKCLIHFIAALNFNQNILDYLLKIKSQLKLICEDYEKEGETPLEKILNETKIANNVVKVVVDKYLTLAIEKYFQSKNYGSNRNCQRLKKSI